jgi:hypothetical protein
MKQVCKRQGKSSDFIFCWQHCNMPATSGAAITVRRKCVSSAEGRAIAQAASRRLPTAEARVRT